MFIARSGRRRGGIVKVRRLERTANKQARERLGSALERELAAILDGWGGSLSQGAIKNHFVASGTVGIVDGPLKYGQLEGEVEAAVAGAFREALDEGVHIGARFAELEGAATSGEGITRRAIEWIESVGTERIAGINGAGRSAIEAFLRDQITGDISPTEAARQIGNVVGLDERGMNALRTFESKLIRRRIPTPEADTQAVRETIQEEVEAYRARLLRGRGETIADTEVSTAIHEGERQFWDQAIEDGIVDGRLMKRWRTAGYGNICERCEALGQKDPIPATDYFVDEIRGVSVLVPTLHPRCRCYIEYSTAGFDMAA